MKGELTQVEKVKVSKEVAEALGVLKVHFKDNQILYLLSNSASDKEIRYKYELQVAEAIITAKSSLAPIETAKALINGYEVEKTELDLFYSRYNWHLETSKFYQSRKRHLDESEREQERYSSGFVQGVQAVAKAYGIKIEGVNA